MGPPLLNLTNIDRNKSSIKLRHNIIQPCTLVPWPWNMLIISCVPPPKKKEYFGILPWPWNISIMLCATLNKKWIFIHHLYIQYDTWKFRSSYTLNNIMIIIAHPSTIHMRHCSSQYYSIKTPNIVHNIHAIHANPIQYLLWCQFLPLSKFQAIRVR